MTFWGVLAASASQVRKNILKVGPKVTGRMSCLGAFSSTFAEKYALEKEVFFGSLPRVCFFQISDAFGSLWWALWRGFCTNIDCSRENTTSQKPWFYPGISTVLTVAAGPGSIQGEKNAYAEAMPVLGSRKNSSANDFLTILGSRGEQDFAHVLLKFSFFINLFFLQF